MSKPEKSLKQLFAEQGLTNQGALETMPCRYGMMSFFKADTTVSRSLKEYGEWAQAKIDFRLNFIGSRKLTLKVAQETGALQ